MITWIDTDTESIATMDDTLHLSLRFTQGQWQGQVIMGSAVAAPICIFAGDEREPVRAELAGWVSDFSARLSAWVAPTE